MDTTRKNQRIIDLSAILEGLAKADIEFILVGGLAAVVQGAPVTTMDIEIVHNRSAENISKLFRFLRSIDAIFRRPDDRIITPKEEDFSGHSLLSTQLGPLDVLAFIEGSRNYEELLKHMVKIEFRGYTIRVLNLKTLIELKRNSKDPKDKQRLPVLEETLQQLDKNSGIK